MQVLRHIVQGRWQCQFSLFQSSNGLTTRMLIPVYCPACGSDELSSDDEPPSDDEVEQHHDSSLTAGSTRANSTGKSSSVIDTR
jgi:hypothetical protein